MNGAIDIQRNGVAGGLWAFKATCAQCVRKGEGATEDAAISSLQNEGCPHAKDVIGFIRPKTDEQVNHPAHYGGDTTYEVIKVLEAWGLHEDAYLFQAVKYIARAGKKDPRKVSEDLKKAVFYLNRKVNLIEGPLPEHMS